MSPSALDHWLSDCDHQVRALSAEVANNDPLDPLDV